MVDDIINKVSQQSLLTLDLEQYLPAEPPVIFDLKPYLFRELILREKDFRAALLAADWSVYAGKTVGITCTADAIIPQWTYMLVANYLQPVAADIFEGGQADVIRQQVINRIRSVDTTAFINQRVVVKGCGDKEIGSYAFLEIMRVLRPVARSVMYGEPCSTVPIFKKKTAASDNSGTTPE